MLVLVHGVPETAQLWDRLRDALGTASVAVELPGFGCARPDGFTATKDAYAEHLVGVLESVGEPVDLVGHDWGALLALRVVTTRPDLVASWAVDVAGGFHERAAWHDLARVWQTPGEGEAFFERQATAPREAVVAAFEALRIPAADAESMAEHFDATMGTCILDLYRSATPNVWASWQPAWAPTTCPGLVLAPRDDPFARDLRLSEEVAARLGARHEVLDDLGHFWPLEDPARVAGVLAGFYDTLR